MTAKDRNSPCDDDICLHCELSQIIMHLMEKHLHYTKLRVIQDLTQIVSEMVSAWIEEGQQQELLKKVFAEVQHQVALCNSINSGAPSTSAITFEVPPTGTKQ